ncbi:MAG: rRNA maturation RNase YbeY [Phycisphaerales bacterium]|nr:rRNA maturation RNase YbeY [Phycisphaerales bacterium]
MSRRAAPLAEPQLDVVDRVRPRTPRPFLARVVRAALAHGGRPAMPVALLLTGDREIGRLHAEFLGDPSPTDVISFAVDDGAEIVVSVDTARRVAKEKGHAARAEVALYVVHGLLHVMGWDDVRPRLREQMRAAEAAIMRSLGLAYAPVDVAAAAPRPKRRAAPKRRSRS